VEEVDQSGILLARYAQGAGIDEPLAESRGTTSEFYEQDGLESVTSLSGPAGAIADTYTYNSFGILTAATGSSGNPFQYTGRDYDPETGLRYYRARYYLGDSGRFLSEDPLMFTGGGANFYIYVKNNATNLQDPLGLFIKPYRWPNAKTRPCNAVEYSECSMICGSRGGKTCRVSQVFRVVRATAEKTLIKWSDGPLSCDCNEECPEPQDPDAIPIIDPMQTG